MSAPRDEASRIEEKLKRRRTQLLLANERLDNSPNKRIKLDTDNSGINISKFELEYIPFTGKLSLISTPQDSELWKDQKSILTTLNDSFSATELAGFLGHKAYPSDPSLSYLLECKYDGVKPKRKNNTDFANKIMQLGLDLEPGILRMACPLLFRYTRTPLNMKRPGIMMRYFPDGDFFLTASPDSVIAFDGSYPPRTVLIEAKLWLKKKVLPYFYHDIPLHYLVQCLVQIVVVGVYSCSLVIYQRKEDYSHYDIGSLPEKRGKLHVFTLAIREDFLQTKIYKTIAEVAVRLKSKTRPDFDKFAADIKKRQVLSHDSLLEIFCNISTVFFFV